MNFMYEFALQIRHNIAFQNRIITTINTIEFKTTLIFIISKENKKQKLKSRMRPPPTRKVEKIPSKAHERLAPIFSTAGQIGRVV